MYFFFLLFPIFYLFVLISFFPYILMFFFFWFKFVVCSSSFFFLFVSRTLVFNPVPSMSAYMSDMYTTLLHSAQLMIDSRSHDKPFCRRAKSPSVKSFHSHPHISMLSCVFWVARALQRKFLRKASVIPSCLSTNCPDVTTQQIVQRQVYKRKYQMRTTSTMRRRRQTKSLSRMFRTLNQA